MFTLECAININAKIEVKKELLINFLTFWLKKFSIKKHKHNKRKTKEFTILFSGKKKLTINNAEISIQNGKLSNKTFLVTGKLSGISRSEIKSLIEKNSGKILSNVNKKLDFLITGEKPTTKKVNLANELGIKIINQDDLLKMLN